MKVFLGHDKCIWDITKRLPPMIRWNIIFQFSCSENNIFFFKSKRFGYIL